MKRFLTAFLTFTMVFSLFCTLPVSAKNEKYNNLLVMGDSISTGFGIEGALYVKPNYANNLKIALGSDNLKNIAVDGATSYDLLQMVKGHKKELADKDVIIFSIGGNDYINTTVKIISKECNIGSDFMQAIKEIFSMSANEINAVFSSETAKTEYSAMLGRYEKNLSEIFENIQKENKNAHIIALNQYNPFSGVVLTDGLIAIDKCADKEISELNKVTKEVASEYNVAVCDTFSAFSGKGMQYTRIISKDIHPNEAGHGIIAELLYDIILNFKDEPATPETSDPFVIYAAVAAVSLSFVCILAKKRSPKKYF